MIDPVYAALALALAAFALPGFGAGLAWALWVLLPLGFALGFVIAALFLYQALIERFGPPTRPLFWRCVGRNHTPKRRPAPCVPPGRWCSFISLAPMI